MKTRSITEAKANISNAADEAFKDGPQTIERRDGAHAVKAAESDRDQRTDEYSTMADLVLNSPIEDGDLPERRPARVIARDFF